MHGQNINLTKFLFIIFYALLVLILINSINRSFDHDELESIHTAWKLLRGEKIFVDFFQHHHPFFYYLLVPLILIFGESTTSIIAARILIYLFLLLILFVTYRLAIKIFNKETGLISVILLSTTPIFMSKAIEIRPDVPQTLFALLSLFYLFTFFDNKSLKNLTLSSFFLGISFLFLQKAIFLMILIGVILSFSTYKKQTNFRELVICSAVFLIPLTTYFLYLFSANSLSSYLMFNWLLNMKILNQFSAFRYLDDTFLTNTLLWVFYVWCFVTFMKTANQKRVGVFSLGLLMSAFFVRAPYKQYFMMAFPLIVIISAYAIHLIFKQNPKKLIVVIISSIVIPTTLLIKDAWNTNHEQLKKIDYVLSLTEKSDFVYDGDLFFNVFRKDIDFFWYSIRPNGLLATYKTLRDYNYNIYELIDKFKPKVISNYNIENDRIINHYVPSYEFNDLFIRKDIIN